MNWTKTAPIINYNVNVHLKKSILKSFCMPFSSWTFSATNLDNLCMLNEEMSILSYLLTLEWRIHFCWNKNLQHFWGLLAKLFCSFDMCQYLLLYGVVRTYIAKLLYTSDKQFMNATSCYMTLLLLALWKSIIFMM